MSASSFPDLAVGVLVSSLRFFSMNPHPTPLPSPTMPSSSRSEKLLRDTLLRDDRERQQLSSPPPPTGRPIPKRRHSHVPSSSSSHIAPTQEDYTRGSYLFRTAMSNPRSPSSSSSSFSQDQELERDEEHSPVRRTLFYGGDGEAINARAYQQQQQQQQRTTSYRGSNPSPSTRRSGRSSNSVSPSPSPLRMKRRQESFGAYTHSTANIKPSPTNDTNLRRNQSLQNTTHNRSGSAYPSPSYGQGEQALRTRLERALTVGESNAGGSHIVMQRKDENEVRDEQGDLPWKRGRQNIGSGSRSASMTSGSVIINSSLTSNSSHSHFQSQFYPHTPHSPQIQSRIHNATQNPTVNNQRSPYSSPLSPHAPYSTPGVSAVPPPSSSPNRTRSQTNPNLPHPSPNAMSPRRNNSSPSTTSVLPVVPSPSWSGKLIGSNSKKSPLPLALGNGVVGKVEEELRLPTPPPSPSRLTRVSLGSNGGYVPSPYKTATATPNGTPTKIPVRTQSPRRKGGLEMRVPTQGPAAAVAVDFPSRHRQRDVTITQQSQQALRSPTSLKKSNNNADGHSLDSSESCSTGTSAFSASHLHIGGVSGYSASSSHSSLDGALPQASPHFPDGHHFVQQTQSIPPTPTTPFNARKASTQCRAIQGYVSFANVEGLGEPPLVGDEFDGDGFGEDGRKGNVGKGRKGSVPFLPLGVLNAALGWKRFLGGTGAEPGIGHGVEGQGVVA